MQIVILFSLVRWSLTWVNLNSAKQACHKTRQTSLQSIIPKDVMTSLLYLLTSNRSKICVQFSTGFWRKNNNIVYWATCGIFIGKTDEILTTLHWCTKSFQNKCHSALFWDKLTENNLGKWRVRCDRCQRRVADNTYRFLIDRKHVHKNITPTTLSPDNQESFRLGLFRYVAMEKLPLMSTSPRPDIQEIIFPRNGCRWLAWGVCQHFIGHWWFEVDEVQHLLMSMTPDWRKLIAVINKSFYRKLNWYWCRPFVGGRSYQQADFSIGCRL
jgi:hypothetical protein